MAPPPTPGPPEGGCGAQGRPSKADARDVRSLSAPEARRSSMIGSNGTITAVEIRDEVPHPRRVRSMIALGASALAQMSSDVAHRAKGGGLWLLGCASRLAYPKHGRRRRRPTKGPARGLIRRGTAVFAQSVPSPPRLLHHLQELVIRTPGGKERRPAGTRPGARVYPALQGDSGGGSGCTRVASDFAPRLERSGAR
jgi:hypothetical protein